MECMRCLVDHANMVNMFWTEKCGCTYIKGLYNYYVRGIDREPHTAEFGSEAPHIDPDYKNILVIRNPFHRLVSGYYDKYVDGNFTCDVGQLTFREFVDVLYKDGYARIDYDHFCPQFSRAFREGTIFHKVYDIDRLEDKTYLDSFALKRREYDLRVNISRFYYSKDHTNSSRTKIFVEDACNLPYQELCIMKHRSMVPFYECFYNDEIVERTKEIYRADFEHMKALGFEFSLTA